MAEAVHTLVVRRTTSACVNGCHVRQFTNRSPTPALPANAYGNMVTPATRLVLEEERRSNEQVASNAGTMHECCPREKSAERAEEETVICAEEDIFCAMPPRCDYGALPFRFSRE